MWPHKAVPSRAGGHPGAAWGLAAAQVEGISRPGALTASLTILPAWALCRVT